MTVPSHYHLRVWFIPLIGLLALASGMIADAGNALPNAPVYQPFINGAPAPTTCTIDVIGMHAGELASPCAGNSGSH